MNFFSEFKRITLESFRLLMGRKKLMVFPLLPILFLLPFCGLWAFLMVLATQTAKTPLDMVFLMLPALLSGLIFPIPFFLAILAIIKETRSDSPVSVSRGIREACRHIRQIFWGFLICMLPFILSWLLIIPVVFVPPLAILLVLLWIPLMFVGIAMMFFWFYFFPVIAYSSPATGIRELLGKVWAAIKCGWAFPLLYLLLMFIIMLALQAVIIPVSILITILGAALGALASPEAGAVTSFLLALFFFPLMMLFSLAMWVYQTIFSALSYEAVMDCDNCRR